MKPKPREEDNQLSDENTPATDQFRVSDRRQFLRTTTLAFAGASAALPPRASERAHRNRVWAVLPAEQAWQQFTTALTDALSDLEEDQYLIVLKKRFSHYVQFYAEGRFGMRVEAVSDVYLEPHEAYSAEQRRRLVSIGWASPTRTEEEDPEGAVDGSPNFFQDVPWPVPFAEVAVLATRTLREFFKVRHPGMLEYKARDIEGAEIRFPALRIRRANEREG
jgi:hypothetical protein